MDFERMDQLLAGAAAEGRSSLLEHEVYAFLAAAGLRTPRHFLVPAHADVPERELAALGGNGVVLKIVSPAIAHKTDVGGVAKVEGDRRAVADRISRMLEEVPQRFPQRGADIRGVLVVERIRVEGEGPGSEALFSIRHNREFGPVITMGVGGVDTELLGASCRKGIAVVSASAALLDEAALLDVFRPTLAYRRLAGLTRAGKRLVDDDELLRLLAALRQIALRYCQDGPGGAWTISELEVNPFAASDGALFPLDGLLSFRRRGALPAPRPLSSLDALMRPKSAAIIGVSAKGMSMGRLILKNILEAGFPKERLWVVRPGTDEIDGVRCVPSAKELPERVDLFVVAVSAEQVPALMEELVEHDRAVGVILIPGGMGEKKGSEALEGQIRTAIGRGRELGRPIVATGGNCLGIVSRPGRYHTLFIPRNKLDLPKDGRGNVAFISQSGAYMISRMSKLQRISPRYAISTGNQVDLTLADFLRHLAGDPEVHTFAVYAEGFKDADGLAFARAAEEITRGGRDLVFYKAGRTAEGKSAASGHTASLAGDYDVCESILRRAGAHLASTFDDFHDLVKISSYMGSRPWRSARIGALSNAGFEAVGIADRLRGEGWTLELAKLGEQTRRRLDEALAKAKLDGLVSARNPLDLTPMATDAVHEDALRALFADEAVDVVLCSTIPQTPAMATLAEGVPEEESFRTPGSLVNSLARALADSDKPAIASVDSGPKFDAMVRAFEEKGVPTFRSVDRAMRAIGLYAAGRTATDNDRQAPSL